MPTTVIIPPTNEHAGRLGRSIVTLDEASLRYPARGVLFSTDAPLVSKTWRRSAPYDQGQTSQCVIFTGKGEINSEPFRTPLNYLKRLTYDTDHMYQVAQELDEWPGEAPDYDGTSVLAGHKAMLQENFISEYRWCFGLNDVLQTLSQHGCVGIGITWYESMFDPISTYGMLNVDTESGVAGGHAVELIGLNVTSKYVIGVNSWGYGWGYKGRFRMKFADLDKLLKDYGEAVTVVR